MRFLAFSAMTVAFIATVSARFDFGRCRTDIPQTAFEDIEATVPSAYRFMAIDRETVFLINALTDFGFKMPLDYECESLSAIEPFKSMAVEQLKADEDADAPTGDWDGSNFIWDDEDLYNLWFPEREDAVLKMVTYLDGSTPVEQWYYCMDAFSLDAIIEQN